MADPINLNVLLISDADIRLSWKDEHKIGSGGFGCVQICTYKDSDGEWRKVAIKRMLNHKHRPSIQKEAEKMLTMRGNPHCVELLGIYEDPDKYIGLCIVMEYMDCKSLGKVIEELTIEYTMDHFASWFHQLASAIDYFHNGEALSCIHRDLKVENILLRDQHRVLKVCDFGTFTIERNTMTDNTGSAITMSPEVFRGKKYTKKCDIFSLGIIIWQVLARQLDPYHYHDGRAVKYDVGVHGKRPTLLNSPLTGIYTRCWEHEPDKRPSSKTVLDFFTKLVEHYPRGNVPPVIMRSKMLDADAGTTPNTVIEAPSSPNTVLQEPYLNCNDDAVYIEELCSLILDFEIPNEPNLPRSAELYSPLESRIENTFNSSSDEGTSNTFISSISATSTNESSQSSSEVDYDHVRRKQLDIKKYPDCMNVLVFGAVDVGKSTFIKGLIKYFNHETVDAAQQNELCDRPTWKFVSSVNADGNATPEDDKEEPENAINDELESSTQEPKSYKCSFGSDEIKKHIRIIDTPGICDMRGIEHDKKTLEKILQYISQFRDIHAICILMKTDDDKSSLIFRYCLDMLFVHLHRSASANIMFCFTSTRETQKKPENALPKLNRYISDFKERTGVEIALNRDNMFYFDTCGPKLVKETMRMFERICLLPVHKVQTTLSLNNARSVILSTHHDDEINKIRIIREKEIQDNMEEMDVLRKNGEGLREKLFVYQEVTREEDSEYPQVVCTAECCIDLRPIPGSPDEMQTIYKRLCHEDCLMHDVTPNPRIQTCWAMKPSGEICRECGCSWKTHIYINYKPVTVKTQVEVKSVRDSLEYLEHNMRSAELLLNAEQQKVDEINIELEKIYACRAQLAVFLQKQSLLPLSDSFGEYLVQLIRRERVSPSELLKQMEKSKIEYDQQKTILTANYTGISTNLIELIDITEMMNELGKLKHCGNLFKDVKNLEMLKVSDRPCIE